MEHKLKWLDDINEFAKAEFGKEMKKKKFMNRDTKSSSAMIKQDLYDTNSSNSSVDINKREVKDLIKNIKYQRSKIHRHR